LKFDNASMSGYLINLGAVQWFMGLLLAEAWAPGYSSRIDYVSDLGTGPTAIIYNVSVFTLGLCIALSAHGVMREYGTKVFPALLVLTGIGAMGVGVFPANLQPMHSLFTLIAILFGSFTAIASFQIQDTPYSLLSVFLGVMALASAVIFFPYLGLPVGSTETFLGMAKGTMERLAIYPILAWAISFGAYLIGRPGMEQPS
jgi:hypothetical membrane protein